MRKTTAALLASMLGQTIFGFSFLFSKLALDIASPFVLLATRFLVAFLTLNLLLLTGKCHLNLKGKPIRALLLLGLFQPVTYFICETYGISRTSSAFSGVMMGLLPVAGLILGAILLKERCTLFQVVCTLTSVVGVVMTTTGGFGAVSWSGFFLLLSAVIAGTLFTILSRSISGRFSPFERTYVMFALGSAVFTAIALWQNRGELSSVAVPLANGRFWVAVIYLGVVSSVCAFMLFNFSVTYCPAGKVLIFSNFTTVISVLAGIFILGDRFTSIQMLGIFIITISVFGVSLQQASEQTEQD